MFWNQIQNVEAFRRLGRKAEFPTGSEIDTKRYVAIIERGICALATMTPEGNERTYMYFKPGNLVGFLRHILSQDQFPHAHIYKTRNRIVAKTKVELTLIDKDDFLNLIAKDVRCHSDFTISLAQNLSNLIEHSALVSCENAPIRICAMLLEFCEKEDMRYFMPACFTQNEMSVFLSLHKITVAKVLRSLKEAGYIRKEGRRVEVVDHARLSQVVNREVCIRY